MNTTIPAETIEQRIYVLRGHRVMLDRNLGGLYGVPTRILNQAVRRHANRFPPDFMFELTGEETATWRASLLASDPAAKMGFRIRPLAFTEEGVSMLSSVLNSERAVEVNIEIIRIFVKLRRMVATHKILRERLAELEKKYDAQFKIVFDAIDKLMLEPEKPAPTIGFKPIK